VKVITAACHEEIDAHLHVQQTGWVRLADRKKRVCVVRVDYHDPAAGILEGVSVALDEPDGD
jgi:hypothetical protein